MNFGGDFKLNVNNLRINMNKMNRRRRDFDRSFREPQNVHRGRMRGQRDVSHLARGIESLDETMDELMIKALKDMEVIEK
jgi:hypothetical protein